jgi:O-antigen/teichoic acid export membrane protein
MNRNPNIEPLAEKSVVGSLRAQSLRTAGFNVFLGVVSIITGMMAARILGVQGRGELAAIQSWPLLIASISMFGLQDAVIYWGSKRSQDAAVLASTATALILLIGIPCAIAGWVLMPYLLSAQSGSVIHMARLYLLFIAMNAMSGLPVFVCRARQRIFLWNMLRLSSPTVWLLVLICARWQSVDSATVIAGWHLGWSAIVAALLAILVAPALGVRIRVIVAWWRPLIRFGAPVCLSALPSSLNLRLDQLLMAGLVPASTLGLYAVAVTWSGVMIPVTSAISSVLFPKLSGMASVAEQKRLLKRALIGTLCASGIGCAIAAVITPAALGFLFGPAFVAGTKVARVLLLGAVFLALNAVLEEGLKGMGRPRTVLAAEGIALVVTIVMLSLLLRPLGALGAGIASVAAYSTATAYLLVSFGRLRIQDTTIGADSGSAE